MSRWITTEGGVDGAVKELRHEIKEIRKKLLKLEEMLVDALKDQRTKHRLDNPDSRGYCYHCRKSKHHVANSCPLQWRHIKYGHNSSNDEPTPQSSRHRNPPPRIASPCSANHYVSDYQEQNSDDNSAANSDNQESNSDDQSQDNDQEEEGEYSQEEYSQEEDQVEESEDYESEESWY